MADQVFSDQELSQIQQILGPGAAQYTSATIIAAGKYQIDPFVFAELVAFEADKQKREGKDEQTKLSQLLAANNTQMLKQIQTEIAIAEAKEAADMMGGDPSKINSPNLPADFKIPDYVIRAHPSAGGNGLYAFATQFIGTKYSWGGTSLEHGCDCSGFVMGVFKHFGVQLDHSSQAQAQEIGKMTGQGLVKPSPSCNSVTAGQIPENAVMTMGPKNGIGHVVIVTHNDKGERVVLQSMGGGVGVCEMPLDKFINYLHRQPAGRTLQIANSGPLLENNMVAKATIKAQPMDPRGQAALTFLTDAPGKGRITNHADRDLLAAATAKPALHHTPAPAAAAALTLGPATNV